MPARTGAQYLAGLQEQPRAIWLDGRPIHDVTRFPGLANGARSVAGLYDMQHGAGAAAMTYASPLAATRWACPSSSPKPPPTWPAGGR